MKWMTLVTAMLLALSSPAFADDKGGALVQNWITKIEEIQPIVAETTTTYTYGKWVAINKAKFALRTESCAG